MSNLSHIMLCDHNYAVAMKYTAWAIKYHNPGRSGYVHKQGFIWQPCCSHCGKQLHKEDNQDLIRRI